MPGMRLLSVMATLLFEGASASRLRAASTTSYVYTHHGQDWNSGVCGSRSRQSPIDLPGSLQGTPDGTLSYMYEPVTSPFDIVNTGHTYSADLGGYGYGGVTYEDAWYNLMNINVHVESEHTWGGQHTPLELHLVHKRYDSEALLVVAVPFKCLTPPAQGNSTGATSAFTVPPPGDAGFNQALQVFLKAAPPAADTQIKAAVAEGDALDLNTLLADGLFYEYAGSMTAPPCAEIVTWFVRQEPLTASDAQVKGLHDGIYAMTANAGNFRSVMPMNGRSLGIRKAVKEDPPPNEHEVEAPMGQATNAAATVNMAKEAFDMAKATSSYVSSLDHRLRTAAEAQAKYWVEAGPLPK